MIKNYYAKEDKILLANIMDKYNQYQRTGISVCSNFLNSRKLKMVEEYLRNKKIPYSVYDKYSFLDKKVIYFGDYDNFISIYKANISDDITHSSILATLFSLGIEEDYIGDIFVEDGFFYYVNLSKMNYFLENNFLLIKNRAIKLEHVDDIILNREHFENSEILVSSMRIDNVISKITKKSRSTVSKMLLDKNVFLNYQEVLSGNVILKQDDILSIRRFGKYRVGSIVNYTKKNNIVLEIIKYI